MSLGSALAIAMSGLRANQAALAIVSSNIANAQTPGYVTQRINQVETLTGDTGASVNVTGVNRELDQFIQAQLRSETSGGAYADQMASVLDPIAIRVRNSRGSRDSRSRLCKFYQRSAIAIDQLGKFIGADLGGDGRTITGAASSMRRRWAFKRCVPMPSRTSTFRWIRPMPR